MSSLSVIHPEPRLILLNDPIAEVLKLLLSALKLWDLLDLLSLEVVPFSPSSLSCVLATTNLAMLQRQKGHDGEGKHKVVGFGLLWQQRANMQ